MRIIGEHFTRQGKPKVTYATFQGAQKKALKLHMRAYQCGFCGKYYLTHKV